MPPKGWIFQDWWYPPKELIVCWCWWGWGWEERVGVGVGVGDEKEVIVEEVEREGVEVDEKEEERKEDKGGRNELLEEEEEWEVEKGRSKWWKYNFIKFQNWIKSVLEGSAFWTEIEFKLQSSSLEYVPETRYKDAKALDTGIKCEQSIIITLEEYNDSWFVLVVVVVVVVVFIELEEWWVMPKSDGKEKGKGLCVVLYIKKAFGSNISSDISPDTPPPLPDRRCPPRISIVCCSFSCCLCWESNILSWEYVLICWWILIPVPDPIIPPDDPDEGTPVVVDDEGVSKTREVLSIRTGPPVVVVVVDNNTEEEEVGEVVEDTWNGDKKEAVDNLL